MAGLRQLCNYDLFKPSLDFGVQLENTLRTIWRPSTIKMLIRPHSSIWAWNDNILCKSVTKGGDLTAPWVLVCLGTVWYSISQNISKPPCGSCPSACARTLPSWSRSTSPFCSDLNSQCPRVSNSCKDEEIKVRCWLSSWTSKFNAFKLWTS